MSHEIRNMGEQYEVHHSLPSAEELLYSLSEGDQKELAAYSASTIVTLEYKYGKLDPTQIHSILINNDNRSQRELMRFARLTGNEQIAKQIVDTLGLAGIKKVFISDSRPEEDQLQHIDRHDPEKRDFLAGKILTEDIPRIQDKEVAKYLDKLREKFKKLIELKEKGQKLSK